MSNKVIIAIDLMGGENAPEKNLEGIKVVLNDDSELKYLKSKIRILSDIGDTANINKLIDNIPLEKEDDKFYNLIFDLRVYDKDIPYICNELQKKKFDVKEDIEKRKTLIACIIAKEKYSQANLALDLLENDSVESLPYIKKVINTHQKIIDKNEKRQLSLLQRPFSMFPKIAFLMVHSTLSISMTL